MPLFSIIIPVYNAERFLASCLDSLIAQTEQSWEAVCIDDGSSDASYEILLKYAEKDSRFRVFHQENGGVSMARNKAMSQAQGEYLLMVDADDRLPEKALASYVAAVQQEPGAELVLAGAIRLYESGSTMGILPAKVDYRGRGCVEVTSALMASMSAYPFAKLYRKSVIEEHGLLYDVRISMCEDFHFNLIYLSYCKKAVIIDDIAYVYNVHSGSTSAVYYSGKAKLSSYTGHIAMIPRTIASLAPSLVGKERRNWLKELYRKNFHLCFAPAGVALRMPLLKACRVLTAVVCSQLRMMAHVSPLVWGEVFAEDVQLFFDRRRGRVRIGCPFDNPSAHL